MKVWTEEDLVARILAGEEKPDFDYKADIDLTGDKKHKAEITKDVIAMANSGGGLIVGGIKEITTGYDWLGMPDSSLKAFDSTALNDFVKNYAGPAINTTTRKVEVEGKVCGVIIVPEFSDQPHIVIRDYPNVLSTGDILVRSTSNNSVRASPDALRKMLDHAVQRRQGVLKDMLQVALESSRPRLVGATTVDRAEVEAPFDRSEYAESYSGFRIITMVPAEGQVSVRPMELREAADAAIVNDPHGYQSFPPPYFGLSTENRLPVGIAFQVQFEDRDVVAFAFFGVDGAVFCTESLWEDRRLPVEAGGPVGIFSTVGRIFEAVLYARRYYPAIGFKGHVRIRFSLESSIPRRVVTDSNKHWPLRTAYTNELAVPIVVEATIGTDASLEELKETTKNMIIEFFWYFHLDLSEGDVTSYLDYVSESFFRIPNL
jgi:hypothetical protein